MDYLKLQIKAQSSPMVKLRVGYQKFYSGLKFDRLKVHLGSNTGSVYLKVEADSRISG